MRQKAVIPRERAEGDVDEAFEYYLSENAPEAALGLVDALDRHTAMLSVDVWRVLHAIRDIPWM